MPPLRPGLILYRDDHQGVTAIMLKRLWLLKSPQLGVHHDEWLCDVMMVYTEGGRDRVSVAEARLSEPFLESLWEAPR